jgi:hypothetical protein
MASPYSEKLAEKNLILSQKKSQDSGVGVSNVVVVTCCQNLQLEENPGFFS